MIYEYAFNINEIQNVEEAKKFFEYISDDRKKKINKLIFEKDVIHSIFAEVIVRFALWEQYGLRNVKIKKGEYGKPYLEDYKDIHFNLSHSGEWVMCAVGDMQIGIDVEQIKEKDLSVSKLVFTSGECEYLSTLDINDVTKEFYKIWTLKESYIKNTGKGLGIPLKSFEFEMKNDEINIIIQGKRNDEYLFVTQQIDENHCTAICVKSKKEKIINDNIYILSINDLRNWKNMDK